jgi:hypothetical protein
MAVKQNKKGARGFLGPRACLLSTGAGGLNGRVTDRISVSMSHGHGSRAPSFKQFDDALAAQRTNSGLFSNLVVLRSGHGCRRRAGEQRSMLVSDARRPWLP